MNNINAGNIYKEYEFIDNVNSTNGIIDLMVIYDDHIDIIDYKTKNIEEDEYLKQVKVYEDFAIATFHKKVNTYLYSLIDGIYKKCN
jgi:ATP-dependent exoDNAse (exonuclease V) beta subunit